MRYHFDGDSKPIIPSSISQLKNYSSSRANVSQRTGIQIRDDHADDRDDARCMTFVTKHHSVLCIMNGGKSRPVSC